MFLVQCYAGLASGQVLHDPLSFGLKTEDISSQNIQVFDPQGRALATVSSISRDPRTGAISYIVVEPGLKDRIIPVPYGTFQRDAKHRLILDIDPGRILTAPNCPLESQPDWNDPVWTKRIAQFWE